MVSHRLGLSSPLTTLKFSSNDIVLASKMEGSMKITPAQKSGIAFNGNQHMSGDAIIGLTKVC